MIRHCSVRLITGASQAVALLCCTVRNRLGNRSVRLASIPGTRTTNTVVEKTGCSADIRATVGSAFWSADLTDVWHMLGRCDQLLDRRTRPVLGGGYARGGGRLNGHLRRLHRLAEQSKRTGRIRCDQFGEIEVIAQVANAVYRGAHHVLDCVARVT